MGISASFIALRWGHEVEVEAFELAVGFAVGEGIGGGTGGRGSGRVPPDQRERPGRVAIAVISGGADPCCAGRDEIRLTVEPLIARWAAVLMLRPRWPRALIDGALAAGVKGLLVKTLDMEGFSAAIVGVAAGQSVISPELLQAYRGSRLSALRPDGNHYHRLSGLEVPAALAVIACPLPVTSLRQSGDAVALRRSRLCYDHLAGELGVALMRSLIDRRLLTGHDGRHVSGQAHWDRPASYGRDVEYRVTEQASAGLAQALGVDTALLMGDRPIVRHCVDWSEEQHHLAGALGASITSRMFELGWLDHGRAARAVRLTAAGEIGLRAGLGIDLHAPV